MDAVLSSETNSTFYELKNAPRRAKSKDKAQDFSCYFLQKPNYKNKNYIVLPSFYHQSFLFSQTGFCIIWLNWRSQKQYKNMCLHKIDKMSPSDYLRDLIMSIISLYGEVWWLLVEHPL